MVYQSDRCTYYLLFFFFSSRRRHTRCSRDWSSDVCSSDLTFLSFLMYRRANRRPVVPWADTGTRIQGAMFLVAAGIVLFYGIRGYFVEAIVRIGYSVYQVLAVLSCILFVTVIDILMARGAQSLGAIEWGK